MLGSQFGTLPGHKGILAGQGSAGSPPKSRVCVEQDVKEQLRNTHTHSHMWVHTQPDMILSAPRRFRFTPLTHN